MAKKGKIGKSRVDSECKSAYNPAQLTDYSDPRISTLNHIGGKMASSRRLEEEKNMTSRKLNLIFVALSIVVICLVFWLIPETRCVFTVVFYILWSIVLLLVMLIVPGLAMAVVRMLIDSAYDNFGESQDEISRWVHFLVCVAFSLCAAVLWIWGVRFIVDLPSWINSFYIKEDGWRYVELMERLPWGWVATGFASGVLGYIFGNRQNRYNFLP